MEHTFPAGKYYIGDPCYVVADKDWGDLLDANDFFDANDGLFEYKGKKCWAAGTAFGDGVYMDNRGNDYPVDAGLLGILPVEACDGESLLDTGLRCGNIINFHNDFRVWEDDGVFHFGTLYIHTE